MKRLHELVEEAARKSPGHPAIEDPERNASLTYEHLDTLADGLAVLLARRGVGPGDRVGVCAPKSIGTVSSFIGILKAGAAYVPVDATAPPTRNAYIFKDCSVKAMIVDQALVGALAGALEGLDLADAERLEPFAAYGANLVLLKGWSVGDPNPVEDLAYILYTSGSTGNPKGVMHTHRSAMSFVCWCSQTFEPDSLDRFSSHAPLHFDLSILDLYVPMKHAATLVLIGENIGKQPKLLARLIADQRITMWYSTPAILRLLVEYGRMERYDYTSLRIVNFAGEVFPLKHLRALRDLWPHPRYFNLYGPTETNVCTFYELPGAIPPERAEPFPIGKACSGDRCRVVDEEHRAVPLGTEGELYVQGGTVMQGYWKLPERTATAFYLDDVGDRWYKTGDVVKEDERGDYVFIGRRDRMVKRRGYRVELGEVEAALYRHPFVSEAAVVAFPDEESGVSIKAFINWADKGTPSVIKLKRYCSEALPLYMIPDRFVFLPSLPKTSTDKMNYQKLKELNVWTSP